MSENKVKLDLPPGAVTETRRVHITMFNPETNDLRAFYYTIEDEKEWKTLEKAFRSGDRYIFFTYNGRVIRVDTHSPAFTTIELEHIKPGSGLYLAGKDIN